MGPALNNVPASIVFWAFRYVLGRSSYAVGDVTDFLVARWPELPANDRSNIVRDIKEHTAKYGWGHKCDEESWRQVLALSCDDENESHPA